MQCPYCQSQAVVKNGKYNLKDGRAVQHHLCKDCGKRFKPLGARSELKGRRFETIHVLRKDTAAWSSASPISSFS